MAGADASLLVRLAGAGKFSQTFFPKFRVEIHLFYNAIVFIPMVIGMYYHLFPPKGEEVAACSCSLHREPMQAVAA